MELSPQDDFSSRHIGLTAEEEAEMLTIVGVGSNDQLIAETIPRSIMVEGPINLPDAVSENDFLMELKEIASRNIQCRSFIGQGYYGTITPSVILRNIFHNPGWYTQYTPYQAEISQGRLEALLNFQTVVSELTALPIANASLLDEGTAAAEAMNMFFQYKNKRRKDISAVKFFVDSKVFPQTVEVLYNRADPLGIELVRGEWESFDPDDDFFGALLQYPDCEGNISDYNSLVSKCESNEIYVTVASDLLSLCLLKPPGEWGAHAVVGNSQRFGVPLGFGGPHAAFFATKEDFKRQIPGRIIGVSIDVQGDSALRMALQTREQHIKRERATSNICTAQALLAIMAGMYAVYHGASGLLRIALRVHQLAGLLVQNLKQAGIKLKNANFFDTISVELEKSVLEKIQDLSFERGMNFYLGENELRISIDEKTNLTDIEDICNLFVDVFNLDFAFSADLNSLNAIPGELSRTSDFLTHQVFKKYKTETSMMRYIKSLENKDLSLMHSMIPLGSCTMKLNAATELLPVSWPEFAQLHPFVPPGHHKGYSQIFTELEEFLCEITGLSACSLQPNSGAQGELSGLMVIRAFHRHHNESHRNIALIPSSAHGTNPASAVMAGLNVVVVKCDEFGNIDVDDLKNNAQNFRDNLAALMVTYPSTHGVFEEQIQEVCNIIHDNGGLVYMDGANMNAQVGLTNPFLIGADVCHLNLHKTFAIPHGGGGPGMGPICVGEKLKPFLPGHVYAKVGGKEAIHSVASAPWGSANILLVSYAYIKMLGRKGVKKASQIAILNANYIKSRLESEFEILYIGRRGRVAHELIVDLRSFKEVGVSAEDVAKRLIDYGFHAPTLSFPVAGTIMIEPTESENKEELDLFCDAMIRIKKEIDEISRGEFPADNNVLVNAPHTLKMVCSGSWNFPYSREKACYPLEVLKNSHKFWPPVARIDNAYGDRHLICTCPSIEAYEEEMI